MTPARKAIIGALAVLYGLGVLGFLVYNIWHIEDRYTQCAVILLAALAKWRD